MGSVPLHTEVSPISMKLSEFVELIELIIYRVYRFPL